MARKQKASRSDQRDLLQHAVTSARERASRLQGLARHYRSEQDALAFLLAIFTWIAHFALSNPINAWRLWADAIRRTFITFRRTLIRGRLRVAPGNNIENDGFRKHTLQSQALRLLPPTVSFFPIGIGLRFAIRRKGAKGGIKSAAWSIRSCSGFHDTNASFENSNTGKIAG